MSVIASRFKGAVLGGDDVPGAVVLLQSELEKIARYELFLLVALVVPCINYPPSRSVCW
jgi:hypothetical protein